LDGGLVQVWGRKLENISVFQLIAPIVCLGFTATFVCIHLYNRNRIAPLFFAFSYLFGAFALTTDVFRDIADNFQISYISSTLYITSASFLVIAFAKHYGRPIPWRPIATIAGLTAVIFVWFFEVQDSMTVRTILMNISAALIFGLSLLIIPRRDTGLIDKIVYWVMVLTVAQFIIRTALVFYVTGETLSAETYSGSAFSKSFHFVVTLNSIGVAITLCILMGMEAIVDLERLSETDALTGLINRRGFEAEAEAHIKDARRKGLPLSLIVCDIDHFKKINDRFGHSFGDWVIKDFGGILTQRCRHSDLVGRIGGEEFCILLPHATAEMAHLVAGACRVSFANKQFRDVPVDTRFTASFGIAEMVADETYQGLFKRADAALYRAKETGRNKVETAASDENVARNPEALVAAIKVPDQDRGSGPQGLRARQKA